MTSQSRSAAEVLDDHLREGQVGTVDEDLTRNYSENLIVLTGRGVYHGHDGLRELARQLREELPDATFEYRTSWLKVSSDSLNGRLAAQAQR